MASDPFEASKDRLLERIRAYMDGQNDAEPMNAILRSQLGHMMEENERLQALLAERDAEIARLRESIVRAGRVHPDGGLCWCGVVTPHHWTGCALVRAALAASPAAQEGRDGSE